MIDDDNERGPTKRDSGATDATANAATAACTIRPFEPGDRDAFLSLYETVFDRERSGDWFRWKYEANPYVDHVPIVVAEADDGIVGCRAFFAQELRIDDAVYPAFQPCDTMVHPTYQGQGIFSRMNEFAIEYYADREPTCCFNFPNEQSKPGNLTHGWQEIGTVPVYYRPQDPVGSVKELTDDPDGETDGTRREAEGWPVDDGGPGTDRLRPGDDGGDGVANALGDAVTSSQQAGDRLLATSSGEFDVVEFETPPPSLLASAYRRAIPDGIHTNRTAEFYEWRFRNPARTYSAYVATRDGETPVAALVCSSVDTHLRIVETLPRQTDAEPAAINQLLAAALLDRGDHNYVTAFGETLPSPLRFRFYPDTRFPLSTLIKPTARTLLARDLGGTTRFEETAIDHWALSRLDLDTT